MTAPVTARVGVLPAVLPRRTRRPAKVLPKPVKTAVAGRVASGRVAARRIAAAGLGVAGKDKVATAQTALAQGTITADRRPQTADRRPQTADRRPQTADRSKAGLLDVAGLRRGTAC